MATKQADQESGSSVAARLGFRSPAWGLRRVTVGGRGGRSRGGSVRDGLGGGSHAEPRSALGALKVGAARLFPAQLPSFAENHDAYVTVNLRKP